MLTAEDHARALAGLLGLAPGAIPDPAVARVAMICEAQRRGLTWRQIGSAIGFPDDPKAAKAAAKRLARHANRALLETAAAQLREAA